MTFSLGPRLRKTLLLGFFGLLAVLLYRYARGVDWPGVWRVLHDMPASSVMGAIGATAAGYISYACLDLLGGRHIGCKLRRTTFGGIAMISYALNLSLGALLGGLGARLRLYSHWNYPKSVPARITLFTALSNWVGYCRLAGLLFMLATPPPGLGTVAAAAMLPVGVVLILLALAYLMICAVWRGHAWVLRGWRIEVPDMRLALIQGVAASASWLAMGLTLYLLLQGHVPYSTVLGALLLAAATGLLTRVPGGLGTTEALLVVFLEHRAPAVQILAAALAYRAIYLLFPLGLVVLAMGVMESRWSWGHGRTRSTLDGP